MENPGQQLIWVGTERLNRGKRRTEHSQRTLPLLNLEVRCTGLPLLLLKLCKYFTCIFCVL